MNYTLLWFVINISTLASSIALNYIGIVDSMLVVAPISLCLIACSAHQIWLLFYMDDPLFKRLYYLDQKPKVVTSLFTAFCTFVYAITISINFNTPALLIYCLSQIDIIGSLYLDIILEQINCEVITIGEYRPKKINKSDIIEMTAKKPEFSKPVMPRGLSE